MVLYYENKKYQEYQFKLEEEFETEVIKKSKLFFGDKTIFIDAKRKIDSKNLGGAIPDGFLFDLTDPSNPEFYLVEVELSTHDFYRHIFPQITKFFAFYKNAASQSELVEKIFNTIINDSDVLAQLREIIPNKEVYKFLKDTIESSQNILLIIDDEKDELPEILETYTDTWGKMVRLLILKKFVNDQNKSLYSLYPDFQELQFTDAESIKTISKTEPSAYTEEYHLDGVIPAVQKIFAELKSKIIALNENVRLNPQRYYISIIYEKNVAYFKFRKKKLRLVVKVDEQTVREIVKTHEIVSLSDSVQKFYNGPSCGINIEKNKNLNEIIEVIELLIKNIEVAKFRTP
jgi:predicted transport protein